jgi:hypothetical protein
MDRKRIIGEVAARHGVRLEEDDPAFLLVTIAEIALRDAQAELLEAVRRTIADQEAAADRLQKSIGEALGKAIRRALSEGGTVSSPQPVRILGRLVFFGVLFGLLLVAAGFALGVMWK